MVYDHFQYSTLSVTRSLLQEETIEWLENGGQPDLRNERIGDQK